MTTFKINYRLLIIIFVGLLFPFAIFAQVNNQTCSIIGYSVLTINGISASRDSAIANKDELRHKLQSELGGTYNGEPLTVDFLFNPSHANGIGDKLKSIEQGLLSDEDIRDTDLLSMLTDASINIKTQKILLVPHSQGNFYANAIRKNLADQPGGIPSESIGIFGVASPASHIYEGGAWLTSTTDKVIAGLIGTYSPRGILPPNTTINYTENDGDLNGHDFIRIYLRYKTLEIILGIEKSLDKLQADPERREDIPCIDAPKTTFMDTIDAATISVVDHPKSVIDIPSVIVANLEITALSKLADVGNYIGQKSFTIAVSMVNTTATVMIWTYNTTVATAVWTYNTTVATLNKVVDMAVATGKAISNTAVITYSEVAFSLQTLTHEVEAYAGTHNQASVITAIQNTPLTQEIFNQILDTQPIATTKQAPTSKPQNPKINPLVAPLQPQPQNTNKTLSTTPSTQNIKPVLSTGIPKLVYIGNIAPGFGGGAPPIKILADIEIAPIVPPIATTTDPVLPPEDIPPSTRPNAPTVLAPDCAYSLAIDGCLLATTTTRFEWDAVPDTAYYLTNKNGMYATSTDLFVDVIGQDFSNYTFDIVAVDNMGITSATSTKTITMATIPIAINEIAWMGTMASASDEWVEVKNNTAYTIDLSQWVLTTGDNTPHIMLQGTIAPHEYLVLERTDDASTSVIAHGVYTGSLLNSGEQLSLLRASVLFDQTPSGVWVAGTSTPEQKSTMERYYSKEVGTDPANWGTNLGFIKNGTDADGNAIDGTPGERNSVSYLINKGNDITSDMTLTPEDGPYFITDTTIVDASSTLTIEPGVDIKFYEGSEFIPMTCTFNRCDIGGYVSPARLDVQGAVHANGTPESPIKISSPEDDYIGAIIIEGKTGTSTINNTTIENLQSIDIYEGNLEMSSSVVRGIEMNTYKANIIIASTTIEADNRGSAINFTDSNVSIASSTIFVTLDSGISSDSSILKIENTTLQGSGGSGASGLMIDQGTATIANTTITGFSNGYGLYIDTPEEPVTVTGGEISENGTGVFVSSDDAVVLTDASIHNNNEDFVVKDDTYF